MPASDETPTAPAVPIDLPDGDDLPEGQVPALPENVPPVSTRSRRGDTLPEWWRERMRKPHRASTLPVPGESAADKGLDMTGFARQYKDLKKVKITDELKDAYIDRLLVHGKKTLACVEVGVHYSTVRDHLKMDPAFVEEIDTALRMRSQMIVDKLEADALHGHVKLTYDKDTGALVAEETKFETPLRLAMLRRHDPEYVDKKEVDVTHRGGVLVVPGRLTMDSWAELFEAKNDPTQPVEDEE